MAAIGVHGRPNLTRAETRPDARAKSGYRGAAATGGPSGHLAATRKPETGVWWDHPIRAADETEEYRNVQNVFAVECDPDRLACGWRHHEWCGGRKRHYPEFRIG